MRCTWCEPKCKGRDDQGVLRIPKRHCIMCQQPQPPPSDSNSSHACAFLLFLQTPSMSLESVQGSVLTCALSTALGAFPGVQRSSGRVCPCVHYRLPRPTSCTLTALGLGTGKAPTQVGRSVEQRENRGSED